MKRIATSTTRTVVLLRDPDAEFVSFVSHGANQRPLKVIKADAPLKVTSIKTKQPATTMPKAIKKAAKKPAAKGTKPVKKDAAASAPNTGVEVHRIVFSKANFASKAEVETYLEQNGYRDYEIKEERGQFVMPGHDITDFQDGTVEEFPGEEDGVSIFSGTLTKAAVEGNSDTKPAPPKPKKKTPAKNPVKKTAKPADESESDDDEEDEDEADEEEEDDDAEEESAADDDGEEEASEDESDDEEEEEESSDDEDGEEDDDSESDEEDEDESDDADESEEEEDEASEDDEEEDGEDEDESESEEDDEEEESTPPAKKPKAKAPAKKHGEGSDAGDEDEDEDEETAPAFKGRNGRPAASHKMKKTPAPSKNPADVKKTAKPAPAPAKTAVKKTGLRTALKKLDYYGTQNSKSTTIAGVMEDGAGDLPPGIEDILWMFRVALRNAFKKPAGAARNDAVDALGAEIATLVKRIAAAFENAQKADKKSAIRKWADALTADDATIASSMKKLLVSKSDEDDDAEGTADASLTKAVRELVATSVTKETEEATGEIGQVKETVTAMQKTITELQARLSKVEGTRQKKQALSDADDEEDDDDRQSHSKDDDEAEEEAEFDALMAENKSGLRVIRSKKQRR